MISIRESISLYSNPRIIKIDKHKGKNKFIFKPQNYKDKKKDKKKDKVKYKFK